LRENFDRFNFAIHKEKEMADFRRWFLAFAALVLVLGSVVPAGAATFSGPQVQCTVNASITPTLRAEGLTELTGDIYLTCQGIVGSKPTPAGTPMSQADISVSFPGTLSTSYVGSAGGLDALLVVDDPAPGNQQVCPSPTDAYPACQDWGNNGAGFNLPAPQTPPLYNVFQGIPGGPAGPLHSITFLGVPVDPPGTGTLTYRITNIRIQAPSVPGAATAGSGGIVPVLAFVATSSSTSVTIPSTQVTVGYVYPGLLFTGTGFEGPNFLQCLDYPDTPVGTLTFNEGFPNSFKEEYPAGCNPSVSLVNCQTQPGLVYYYEGGLNIPIPSGGITGLATNATELTALLTNVPSGVYVCVDTTDTDAQGISATIVSPIVTPNNCNDGQTEVLNTTSAAPCTSETSSAAGTCGSAQVIWNVTSSNLAAFPAALAFNVYTLFNGAPASPAGSPTQNVTAYAQGGFWPQESAWANGGPVPEFVVGFSPAAPGVGLFSVSLCQTILLFPYVTDYYGFDTGIAISNTSLDNTPVPALPQTGACTVAFYDDGGLSITIGTAGDTPGYVNSNGTYGALTPINGSGLISPGQTWAFSLSETDTGYNSAPGSGATGYAIATCNFQYAHGYSFVSDTGIRNFAAAYLALIIPDAPRSPNPFLCATYGGCGGEAGEQLVH
jgi:hypothetical protein